MKTYKLINIRVLMWLFFYYLNGNLVEKFANKKNYVYYLKWLNNFNCFKCFYLFGSLLVSTVLKYIKALQLKWVKNLGK